MSDIRLSRVSVQSNTWTRVRRLSIIFIRLSAVSEELYVGRGEQFVYFNLSVVSYGFTYVDRGEKIVSDFFSSPAVYFFV